MYVFTMPADKWDEKNPNKQAILQLILKHQRGVDKLNKLKNYYEGKHRILEDAERENRLVCNHAKDISDTASGYFIGKVIGYYTKGQPARPFLYPAMADNVEEIIDIYKKYVKEKIGEV